MIYFFGNRKQLKAFLQYLLERYGRDAKVADMPQVVCR